MKNEVQNLIEKANIINKTGRGPGIRYPQSLKDIIISLRDDHQLSAKKVTELTGVSIYSAREWPKLKNKNKAFKKIHIIDKEIKNEKHTTYNNNYYNELNSIIFNLKVLVNLIIPLIFLILFLHLIF